MYYQIFTFLFLLSTILTQTPSKESEFILKNKLTKIAQKNPTPKKIDTEKQKIQRILWHIPHRRGAGPNRHREINKYTQGVVFDQKPWQNFVIPKQQIPNPEFLKVFHQRDINYFKLNMILVSEKNPLGEVIDFLKNWFSLDVQNESIEVSPYIIDGKEVMNRYIVKYLNKINFQKKQYIIEFNFYNNKDNREDLVDPKFVDILGASADASYETNFDYTKSQDCLAIKLKIFNPDEMDCQEFVNKEGYVLSHVYKVTAKYKKFDNVKTREGLFIVVGGSLVSNTNLEPDQKPSLVFKPKPNMIKDLIFKKIRLIKNNFPQLRNIDRFYKYIQSKVKQTEENLIKQRDAFEAQLQQVEKAYQEQLRQILTNNQVSLMSEEIILQKNLDLLDRKADEINAYLLDINLRRTIHKNTFDHSYKVYWESRTAWVNDQKEFQELDKELSNKYQQDMELEKNFSKNFEYPGTGQ